MVEIMRWLKRKKFSEDTSPQLSLHSQEIKSDNPFSLNQKLIIEAHKKELPEFVQQPYVSIVKRAYRELSNGNLTTQLDSLSSLRVHTGDVEAIFVVNNPRIVAIIAHHGSELAHLDEPEIVDYLEQYYQENNLQFSDFEQNFLQKILTGKKQIERIIDAFIENQITLRILRIISSTVIDIIKNPRKEAVKTQQLLRKLSAITAGMLDEDQTQLLLKSAKKIVRKRLITLGIDCSSESKAFKEEDLGQATNQGSHIAIARGAQYIDISDMDEFHSPTGLQEILYLAQTSAPDVMYRPLKVVTPQHPEQMKFVPLESLVNYYRYASLKRADSWRYVFYKPELDRDAAHNSGHIVVSAEAFKKHQYPHGSWFEDLVFSGKLQTDTTLEHTQLLDFPLLLSERGRAESFDGSIYGRHIITKNITDKLERLSAEAITEWLTMDQRIIAILNQDPQFVTLLTEYNKTKKHLMAQENNERRSNRLIFLSENGFVHTLFDFLSGTGTIAENAPALDQLSSAQRVFLKNNPAWLRALREKVKEHQFQSPDAVCEYLEHLIPELLTPPVSYEDIDQLTENYTIESILEDPSLLNTSLWLHVYKAQQWLAALLTNQLKSKMYSSKDEAKLDDLLRVITTN